jgi:plastocyanin
MSFGRRHLPLVAAIGAAAAMIPGLARSESSPPSTAAFTASDTAGGGYYTEEHHSWHIAGGTATQVTVAQGATVTFSYPEGKSKHNVAFSGAVPSACTQTTPPAGVAVPPLPHEPTKAGWSGSCTFNTPGTFNFRCEEHPTEMTGTIVVQAASQPPATTGSGTGTSGPSLSGGGSTGPANSLGGSAVRLPSTQHGAHVAGSVQVAQTGSKLEVDALANAAQLARAHSPAHVTVGRLVRSSLTAGRVSFALSLNARARRALRRHRRLALTVRIALTAPGGSTVTRTLAIVLRRP